MDKLLRRTELQHLLDWSSGADRKPLIIRGARQVGKSTLVRQLASELDLELIEINFERNPEFQDAFSVKDPVKILTTLALLTGQKIVAGQSLLFFDEIQSASEGIVALRYFYEEMQELHVLAAGSLLEFTLAEMNFSMPVGRVEYMYLGPMQYEDYLLAMGDEQLSEYLRTIRLSELQEVLIPNALHQKYISRLREFCIIGGMPEAIACFTEQGEYSAVKKVQKNILATYRDDFSKYSHGVSRERIQLLFDKLPTMVGQKFKYSRVSSDHRSSDIASALMQLCMARIAYKIPHTSGNGVPLGAEVNERHFKTLFLDVGLMNVALGLNLLDLERDDLLLINKGAVAEQFTGQHLLYNNDYYETPNLYYWIRQAKSAAAEVDYLISIGPNIVPIEVKAGKTGSLKSLHQYLGEKQRQFGLRFNIDQPSLLRDRKKLADQTTIEYDLLSLPLYMLGQTRRLLSDYFSKS